MLPEGTIAAERLWKRFRADRSRRAVRDQLERLGEERGSRRRGWRWALRDIDLHAEPGEAIGLFGANGSGKSTLLKILTGVMYPYAGRLSVSGRIGALIEVRAGIHPQLTGRENAFLYGSLLGLDRRSVARRFDEIVAFAELEDAIDRQTKFYSSGMQMRLGFAVAAFLDPSILLVDEILAVGDASFQHRCLERMREVLADGTTLVFVSHDLASIEAVSTRGVWLDRGIVRADGPVHETLGQYRQAVEERAELEPHPPGPLSLLATTVRDAEGGLPRTYGDLDIDMRFANDHTESGALVLGFSEGTATPIFLLRRDIALQPGEHDVRCRIHHLPLPRGRYYLWVGVVRHREDLLAWHPVTAVDVAGPDIDTAPSGIVRLAPVHVLADWDVARAATPSR
jgi:ABC-type polysaccharide/polyol phosphate transport system ATPase subunit